MKNILQSKDSQSEELLMRNELKICNHLSNEERNNDSNGKILSLLKDELLYSLNDEKDKLFKRAISKILIRYSGLFDSIEPEPVRDSLPNGVALIDILI